MTASALAPTAVETARARASVYAFFAGAFGQRPSPALVERARGGLAEELAPLGDDEAAALLRRFAARDGSAADLATALEVEYTTLFVLPSGGKGQPFESIYEDPEHRLGGPVSIAAERAYARAGAELALDRVHIADHVSVELEFMAFLCAREREAWEAGATDVARGCAALQRDFLERHLARWIGRFAADVGGHASTELYPALTRFAAAFVRLDLEDLRETSPQAPEGGA